MELTRKRTVPLIRRERSARPPQPGGGGPERGGGRGGGRTGREGWRADGSIGVGGAGAAVRRGVPRRRYRPADDGVLPVVFLRAAAGVGASQAAARGVGRAGHFAGA